MMLQRFALLSYTRTLNLGDEVQSLAAAQFLPERFGYIDREQLNDAQSERVKTIFNGWFMHEPQNWPPHELIEPLLTSMHITNEISERNRLKLNPSVVLLAGENLNYLKNCSPIGARDLYTLDLLHRHDLDAYFSGCLTLTFPRWLGPRSDKVVCVDLDDDLFASLRESSGFDLVRASHYDHSDDRELRFDKAANLLNLYKSSRMLITNRLHAALPSLAFGTPVIFVETAPDSYRFSGLRELLHTVCRDDVLKPRQAWWRSEFETNKDLHGPLAAAHRQRVADFIARPMIMSTPKSGPILIKTDTSTVKADRQADGEPRLSVRTLLFGDDIFADLAHEFDVDAQGWNSDHPVFERMIRQYSPQLIVEVGTWKGASALHMAGVCKALGLHTEIVCVDTWLGNWQAWTRAAGDGSRIDLRLKNGFPHLYWQFLSNIKHAGFTDRITPLPLPSYGAAKLFAHHGLAPDLVYIDGDHEYEAVRMDLDSWYELLVPGGVLIGDDLGFKGVGCAAAEFERTHGPMLWTDGSKFVFRKHTHHSPSDDVSETAARRSALYTDQFLNSLPILLIHGADSALVGDIASRMANHPQATAAFAVGVAAPAQLAPRNLDVLHVVTDVRALTSCFDLSAVWPSAVPNALIDEALLERGQQNALVAMLAKRTRLRILVICDGLAADDALLSLYDSAPPERFIVMKTSDVRAYPAHFFDGLARFCWLPVNDDWLKRALEDFQT